MKKIFLGMLILGIMVVGVSAAIYYNSTINVNADITEPFVTSTFPLSFNGYATDTINQTITITNNAERELPATITWLPREDLVVPDMMSITAINNISLSEEINLLNVGKVIQIPSGENSLTVSFRTLGANIGSLNLAKKTVDFNESDRDVLNDQVTMQYSKIGDKFTAEIVNGSNESYELIYYADVEDRFDNPAPAISIKDVEGNLPYESDANSNVTLYDYCDNKEYSTCNGAKIWYIPSDAINDEGELDWSRANEFYFETDLITYTQSDTDSIGIITVERVEA